MDNETFQEGIAVLSSAIVVAAIIICFGLFLNKPKIDGYDLIRAAERAAAELADGDAKVECLRQGTYLSGYKCY